MKKTTTSLSALAVAAALSAAAIASSKSSFLFYCTAYEQIEDQEGGIITVPYAYNQWDYPDHHPGPCTHVVALTISAFSFYTMYGYVKTTPTGTPCGGTQSCPAIRGVQEF